MQRNKAQKYIAGFACLCLCLCAVLAVGITYGRYQWEFPRQSYVFSPAVPDHLVMCGGGISQAWIDAGNLPQLPGEWERTELGAKLDFGVVNGEIGSPAKRDQSYQIQLISGLHIIDPENLTVTLEWQDDMGQTHSAEGQATAIQKGSVLYDTYGDGWIYSFALEEALVFTLEGGHTDYHNYTITVSGEAEPTLLQLRIAEADR